MNIKQSKQARKTLAVILGKPTTKLITSVLLFGELGDESTLSNEDTARKIQESKDFTADVIGQLKQYYVDKFQIIVSPPTAKWMLAKDIDLLNLFNTVNDGYWENNLWNYCVPDGFILICYDAYNSFNKMHLADFLNTCVREERECCLIAVNENGFAELPEFGITELIYEVNKVEAEQKTNELSDAQLRFIELDKKKAEWKLFLEDYKQAVKAVVAEIGLDAYFQDSRDKIVYRTAEQDGRYVYNEVLTIQHTKREGEKAGTVSMKDAKEQGFEL